jgi:glutathione S-transferase
MAIKLFVVHGSHPCACVEKALQLKGLDYRIVELPPPMHAPIQKLLFGQRTVPGVRLEGGEKVVGSRPILRRLEQLAPEPPLFPADPEQRARVEAAEAWGEETLQPVARRMLWPAMRRRPDAIVSYIEGSRLPLPAAMARLLAPGISVAEMRLNRATSATLAADLAALPGQLDQVDGYIADAVIGGEQPNAADLQIASTVRLLMTLADLDPLIRPRPAGELALRLFPTVPGRMPAGALPPELVPQPAVVMG